LNHRVTASTSSGSAGTVTRRSWGFEQLVPTGPKQCDLAGSRGSRSILLVKGPGQVRRQHEWPPGNRETAVTAGIGHRPKPAGPCGLHRAATGRGGWPPLHVAASMVRGDARHTRRQPWRKGNRRRWPWPRSDGTDRPCGSGSKTKRCCLRNNETPVNHCLCTEVRPNLVDVDHLQSLLDELPHLPWMDTTLHSRLGILTPAMERVVEVFEHWGDGALRKCLEKS
jgi:hypothetical protein